MATKTKTKKHEASFYLVRDNDGWYYACHKPYLNRYYYFNSSCSEGVEDVAPFLVMKKGEYRRLRVSDKSPKNKDFVILHRLFEHSIVAYHILNDGGIIKHWYPTKKMLRAMNIKKDNAPYTLYLYEI